ncbi:MAG: type II toxin-antitoxin system YafQ family toxin [Lachnospiraceae bacterium]|nr:type II toxin-antitoxin system YafQ family toxin [Butyrivibrio sp.]MCM1344918.1 type II toxin-antitoxin system YafQ family toxin [Muribaculaceae bacterium]MCM1409639.1 type II toxin-antitoxin system YafQ family toxin [Lachnospiraceae bacterium]
MRTIRYGALFKKDYKRVVRRGYDIRLLEEVIRLLIEGKVLPPKYKDHGLSGDYSGCRECHITPDWLLVYELREKDVILYLTRTGSHSDLF